MWQTFTAFLFAHVLADFVFQSRATVEGKARSVKEAVCAYVRHGATVAIWSFVVLFPWEYSEALFRGVLEGRILEGEAVPSVWRALHVPGAAVFLAVVHVVIDWLKIRGCFGPARSARAFLTDQGLHFLSLVVMAAMFPGLAAASIWPAFGGFLGFGPAAFWGMIFFLTGLIVATRAGGFFVQEVLKAFPEATGSGEQDSLRNAGAFIGHAERLMIYLFLVFSGRPEAIALLLAVKSLRDYSAREGFCEYVIVGTLVSFAWAVAVSYGTMALLSALGVAVPLWGT